MNVYRFASERFRLAVHATSLKAARDYVNAQAMSSLTHRALRYVGEGHPDNPAVWCAASVRS